jgi:hypothetical protein
MLFITKTSNLKKNHLVVRNVIHFEGKNNWKTVVDIPTGLPLLEDLILIIIFFPIPYLKAKTKGGQ